MKNAFLLIVFLFSFKGVSQQNDTKAALYNIGLGSVFGGIGAMINKKPQEKYNKVFIKGLYQGALGGAVVFGSKKMVYNYHKNKHFNMLWSAKLVNSAGISIIENAASNRNIWEKWHINIGFNRIEIDNKDKVKIRYKLLPMALIGAIIPATKGKFNLKYSLQTLTPIFISNSKIDATLSKRLVSGEVLVNSIIILNESYKVIIAHEILHTFQYDDYLTFDLLFPRIKNKWSVKSKLKKNFSKYIHFDIPSYTIHAGLYLLEKKTSGNCYFDNFFEAEANFYSNKYTCP